MAQRMLLDVYKISPMCFRDVADACNALTSSEKKTMESVGSLRVLVSRVMRSESRSGAGVLGSGQEGPLVRRTRTGRVDQQRLHELRSNDRRLMASFRSSVANMCRSRRI